MENLFSILIVVGIVIMLLRLFVFKKKRKSVAKRRIDKFKFIFNFFKWGMIWVPLILMFCVNYPQQALFYAGKMGLVFVRVKSDVKRTSHRLDTELNRTLEPFTPKIGKQVLKVAKRSYNRYGVRDTQRVVVGGMSQVGIRLYKPEPSLFEKVGKGISGAIKIICLPIRQVLGFLGL